MTANTYATEDYADDAAAAAAAALVDAAPGTLDTLNELAAALGDDAAFSTTVTNALALKAPLASPAFTGTPTGITKTHVGLGNADNTADTAKPVSTAQQTALDLKAPLASPALTGNPTVPTQTAATNNTRAASTAYADAAVAAEATLARNADNLTSGTVADARIASTIARDSEVAAAYQPLDPDLTTLSGLTATTDNIVQSVASAWASRTPAQLKATLALAKGDVGLGNVDNTADASKTFAGEAITSGTVADARIASTIARDAEVAAGYQPIDSDLTAIAAISPTNDDFIQRKSGAWVARSMAQLKTDLVLVKGDVGLGNVDNTADSAKTFAGEAITSGTVAIARLPLDADVATFALPASTTISAFGATLIDDAAASNARTTLGLDSMATQAASAVAITGGSVIGITDLVVADGGTGAGTFTDRGVLIGRGTAAFNATAAGTADFPLVSNGSGANPAFEQLNLATAVQGLLSPANGGLGSVPQWQDWIPTVDQGVTTGIAHSLAFARYIEIIDTVIGVVRLTLTASGTAGSEISVSLPVAVSAGYSANVQAGSGFLTNGGSSYKCIVRITNASGRFALTRTDDATTANPLGQSPSSQAVSGNLITFTFIYEAVV